MSNDQGRAVSTPLACYYCGIDGDLRPYGPRGAMVCFPCAMSTPERKRDTERNFGAQLDACGPVAAIDGSNVGPFPHGGMRQ